jgi:hypothetical protein
MELDPFSKLVGEWVLIVLLVLQVVLAITSYKLLTCKAEQKSDAGRSRTGHRILVVAGLYISFFAAVFLMRPLLLETVVATPPLIGSTVEWHDVEKKLGFSVSLRGFRRDSQHILFLRIHNREKLETLIEQRRRTQTNEQGNLKFKQTD